MAERKDSGVGTLQGPTDPQRLAAEREMARGATYARDLAVRGASGTRQIPPRQTAPTSRNGSSRKNSRAVSGRQ